MEEVNGDKFDISNCISFLTSPSPHIKYVESYHCIPVFTKFTIFSIENQWMMDGVLGCFFCIGAIVEMDEPVLDLAVGDRHFVWLVHSSTSLFHIHFPPLFFFGFLSLEPRSHHITLYRPIRPLIIFPLSPLSPCYLISFLVFVSKFFCLFVSHHQNSGLDFISLCSFRERTNGMILFRASLLSVSLLVGRYSY